ncbi:MAG TPA: hypothetical protein VFK03_00585 [Candidatus Saccharimonadales bacterium]|nr:hypothetical protein [Candidatus Saccharimonadales bacterium]
MEYAPNAHRSGQHDHRSKLNLRKLAVVAVVVVLVVIGLILGGWFARRSSTASAIDKDNFQAVFLTNGQVYFGKLSILNGDYFKLKDIYYLQAKSTDKDSNNPQKTSGKDEAGVQLIELGHEIHAPKDEMIIDRNKVLFFENLKPDGKVSQSITEYQSHQDGQ